MEKTIVADARFEKTIEYALSVLLSQPYREYIEAVYLFGSCARGTQRYSSDIDLLVQHTEKMDSAHARMLRIAVMPEMMLPEVDVKFVNGDAWKKRRDPFSRNLVREGELLWKRK